MGFQAFYQSEASTLPGGSPLSTAAGATAEARAALRSAFGFPAFRPHQEEAALAALSGRDSLVLLPTGSGKSLCYQVPAICLAQAGRGPTLVISPLIALMEDQVRGLRERGIPAAAIHSGIPLAEQRETLGRAPELALLYVSPERLKGPRFRAFLRAQPFALAAVDEAHCIAQWGHDFRPDYLTLSFLKEGLGLPVMALTATAPPRVAAEILQSLGLVDPALIRGDFTRPNLSFAVEHLKGHTARADRALALLAEAGAIGRGGPGRAVIYAATRRRAKAVWERLRDAGIRAAYYHAGRTDGARLKAAEGFASGDRPVIVATQAFGMGIDHPDVRLVCHVETPGSLEAYYQEAGRAGRDGAPARCVLLYSDADPLTQARIGARRGAPHAEESWRAMMAFVHSQRCRQVDLLAYLTGEEGPPCGRCDVCLRGAEVGVSLATLQAERRERAEVRASKRREEADWDVTEAERAIIVAFVDSLKKPLSAPRVAKALRGSRAKDIKRLKLAALPHFGALKATPEAVLRREIAGLLKAGRLAPRGQKYPTVWIPEKPVRPASRAPRAKAVGPRDGLKTALREMRKREARRRRWKAYQVFSNQTLEALLAARPRTEKALLAVPGMGPRRVERFGAEILALVAAKTDA